MHLNKLAAQVTASSPVRKRETSAAAPSESEAAAVASDGVAISSTPVDPVSSRPPAQVRSAPSEPLVLQPEVGRIYAANQRQPRAIQLSFDEAAVAFVKNANLQVDLENASLITRDGRQVPLDGRVPAKSDLSHGYAVASGTKLPADAEPWQFRVPATPGGIFGKPHGIHIVGGDSGLSMKFLDPHGKIIDRASQASGLDDFQGLRVDTRVFRRDRSATLGRVASHVPSPTGLLGPASLPFQDTEFPNVTMRAPSEQSLAIVKNAFAKLLGPLSRARAEKIDLPTLEIYEAQFQELIARKIQEGGEIDGLAVLQQTIEQPLARQAMEMIYGEGAGSLDNGALLNAVAEKAQKASPLEIIVIPRDKTAADCVELSSDEERQELSNVGRAWFQTSNPIVSRAQSGSKALPSQRLFIGEEILQSDKGVKAVLMHELLHIFEQRYANSEESATIENSYQSATEFQSLYGSNRHEYLTTVSEEFLAAHGPEGPQWVKDQHPGIHWLLATLIAS